MPSWRALPMWRIGEVAVKSPSIVAADVLISVLLGASVGWGAAQLTVLVLAAPAPWPGFLWICTSAILLTAAWEVQRRLGITGEGHALLWSGGAMALLAVAILPLTALAIAGPVVGTYGLGLPVIALTPWMLIRSVRSSVRIGRREKAGSP